MMRSGSVSVNGTRIRAPTTAKSRPRPRKGNLRAAGSRCGQVRHSRARGELGTTTSAPGTRGSGRSFAASPSTKRTASTSWTRRAPLTLDPALLARFPVGHRHLGYLQTRAGFTVKTGLPGLTGEAIMRLYDEGAK